MSLVEWAEAALPLLVLGWAMCLVASYPEALNAWLSRFSTWYTESLARRRG